MIPVELLDVARIDVDELDEGVSGAVVKGPALLATCLHGGPRSVQNESRLVSVPRHGRWVGRRGAQILEIRHTVRDPGDSGAEIRIDHRLAFCRFGKLAVGHGLQAIVLQTDGQVNPGHDGHSSRCCRCPRPLR
jgi:hypothetical protein